MNREYSRKKTQIEKRILTSTRSWISTSSLCNKFSPFLFIYLFTYLFLYLFVYLFICLFVYLFIYLFIYYLFVCLFIYFCYKSISVLTEEKLGNDTDSFTICFTDYYFIDRSVGDISFLKFWFTQRILLGF